MLCVNLFGYNNMSRPAANPRQQELVLTRSPCRPAVWWRASPGSAAQCCPRPAAGSPPARWSGNKKCSRTKPILRAWSHYLQLPDVPAQHVLPGPAQQPLRRPVAPDQPLVPARHLQSQTLNRDFISFHLAGPFCTTYCCGLDVMSPVRCLCSGRGR